MLVDHVGADPPPQRCVVVLDELAAELLPLVLTRCRSHLLIMPPRPVWPDDRFDWTCRRRLHPGDVVAYCGAGRR